MPFGSAPSRLKPKPSRLHHDHETFSLLDLMKVGIDRYSKDDSTEILMTGYAFDDGPVKQWVPEEGQSIPAELEDALLDPDIKKYAWNAPFEWHIWKYVYGIEIPIRQFRDPMVMALACAFPGKLLKTGQVLKLPPEYLKKDGTRLINWFSKLRPATKKQPPRRVYWYEKYDKWLEYLEYNRYDVLSERKIYRLLRPYDLPDHEWEYWALDQEINRNGIPINMEMCRNIIEVRDILVAEMFQEMKDITGLENPNSNEKLRDWLQDHGYVYDDLQAAHIKTARDALVDDDGELLDPRDAELHRVLDLRSEVSKSSTKKFDAIEAHVDADDLLRNCFQFAAAGRTWRWGGRVLQPQNLASPAPALKGLKFEDTPAGNKWLKGGTQISCAQYLTDLNAEAIKLLFSRPMDAMSGAVRTVIQAPPGMVFVDADLRAIENVVLGWLANDEKILNVFKNNLDPYIDFATQLYGESYENLWHEYKVLGEGTKRKVAKPGVLGCGYMLSAGREYINHRTGEVEASGLLGYGRNMGVYLTSEEAELSVQTWRRRHKKAVQFWYDLQKAAFKTVKTKQATEVRHVGYDAKGSFMRAILPSDRCLHYYKPRLRDEMKPWGELGPTLSYMGLDERNQWNRITTHPGKQTENVDQAIARDLLAHGLRNAILEGLHIVMHVHDQILALVPENQADEKLALLIECMTDLPRWARGMPVAAAGHISKWFVKD